MRKGVIKRDGYYEVTLRYANGSSCYYVGRQTVPEHENVALCHDSVNEALRLRKRGGVPFKSIKLHATRTRPENMSGWAVFDVGDRMWIDRLAQRSTSARNARIMGCWTLLRQAEVFIHSLMGDGLFYVKVIEAVPHSRKELSELVY